MEIHSRGEKVDRRSSCEEVWGSFEAVLNSAFNLLPLISMCAHHIHSAYYACTAASKEPFSWTQRAKFPSSYSAMRSLKMRFPLLRYMQLLRRSRASNMHIFKPAYLEQNSKNFFLSPQCNSNCWIQTLQAVRRKNWLAIFSNVAGVSVKTPSWKVICLWWWNKTTLWKGEKSSNFPKVISQIA